MTLPKLLPLYSSLASIFVAFTVQFTSVISKANARLFVLGSSNCTYKLDTSLLCFLRVEAVEHGRDYKLCTFELP